MNLVFAYYHQKESVYFQINDLTSLAKLIQWAPLNGITLGPRQIDPINRMIPLTKRTLVRIPNRPWIS